MTIGYTGEPDRFDPIAGSEGTSADLMHLMFNSLVKADSTLAPVPDLAESWEVSADGRTLTFYLRHGVRFHNGAELTADDVLHTYERVRDPAVGSPYAPSLQLVERFEAIDSYTFRVTLADPQPSFLLYAMRRWVIPKHSGERDGFPVGTGPFRLVHWAKGKELEFAAHKDYFGGPPHIARIIARPYPDHVSMWVALMKGEIDLTGVLPSRPFDVVQTQPGFSTLTYPGPFYYLILFNLRHSVFQDRRVREALSCAIDRKKIIRFALSGYGLEATGPFLPGSWAANPDVKPAPYDPQRSLSLLRQAGYRDTDHDGVLEKDGRDFRLDLIVADDDEIKRRAAPAIQQAFREIGAVANVSLMSPDTLLAHDLYRGEFQMVFVQINAGIDPAVAALYWHSAGRCNYGLYNCGETDSLLALGERELGASERATVYRRIHNLIASDHPACFLFFRKGLVGLSSRLRGVQSYPESILTLSDQWTVVSPGRLVTAHESRHSTQPGIELAIVSP